MKYELIVIGKHFQEVLVYSSSEQHSYILNDKILRFRVKEKYIQIMNLAHY